MPPLTKTCPKMVLPRNGVAFVCKTLLQKNFLVSEEIPLVARSHRFFGNTLAKAGHPMRLSIVSGTVRGLALQGGQGLAAPIQNDSALPQGPRGASGAS